MASYVVEDNVSKSKSKDKKTFLNSLNLKGFKKIKNLLIILLLLIVAVVFYNSLNSNSSTNTDISSGGYTTSVEYIKLIEAKLNKVVGEIKGVGKVSIMLSVVSSPELKIAENVEEKTVTTSSGTTLVTTSEPIIVDDSPLVLKETLPDINGVIVVSSGASDVKVKLDILNAVSVALGISPNKIEVFVGE